MTLQMRKNQPRWTAELAPRRPPDPVSYWLIAEKRSNRIEVLTIRTDEGQETLPIFSSEEEAEMILRFGGVTGGWWARESGAGELVSILFGSCASVKKVALPVARDGGRGDGWARFAPSGKLHESNHGRKK
jgi:hypothetical protein